MTTVQSPEGTPCYFCRGGNPHALCEYHRGYADAWTRERVAPYAAAREGAAPVAPAAPNPDLRWLLVARPLLPELQEWSGPVRVKVTSDDGDVIELLVQREDAYQAAALRAAPAGGDVQPEELADAIRTLTRHARGGACSCDRCEALAVVLRANRRAAFALEEAQRERDDAELVIARGATLTQRHWLMGTCFTFAGSDERFPTARDAIRVYAAQDRADRARAAAGEAGT